MACRGIGRVTSVIQQHNRLIIANSKRNFSAALLSPSFEYPELPFQPGSSAKASETNVTTLPSGLTIVTENASYATNVSLTFPYGGSQHEASSESGASLANKHTSFKSASGLSTLVIIRSLENEGATPYSFADRYTAGVGFTCVREKVDRIVPLLATRCSYEKWDLRDSVGMANDVVDDAMTNAQAVLTEQMYAAAYGAQTSIGRPFHAKNASKSSIISFRERSYIANGAVLSATGIEDHGAFVKTIQEGFSELSAGSPSDDSAKTTSTYLGGESRINTSSHGYAHIAMGFKGIEGNTPLRNIVKHCLTTMSPSNVTAFASPGITGLYTAALTADASTATDALTSAFLTPLTKDIIAKAKTAAKSEAIFAMNDSSKALAQDMTDSVLETGTFSTQGVIDSYDSIEDDVVMNAVSSMIGCNLSLAAVGEVGTVPYHATIAARFS